MPNQLLSRKILCCPFGKQGMQLDEHDGGGLVGVVKVDA